MNLLYAGFDTIDFAIQGALPVATVDLLKRARDDAAERQEPVLLHVGPGNVALHVHPGGLRGGYAIRADTGPLGEVLAFKANSDPQEWNAFASIRASTLAAYGYKGARDQVWKRLAEMGFAVRGHSVNRIDFAMDFLTEGFTLSLDSFVAHPRTKVRPHWGSLELPPDRNQPAAVCRGRRLESVTVGKMPGRQIIVYDKRRAAIEQRKLFWFKVWGIDRRDPSQEVWRVELRAGKKELKDRWGIRSFDDVDLMIGDVMRHALGEVRYIDSLQTDSNVSRQRPHPLWSAVTAQVERELWGSQCGLLPSQVREVERELAIETYLQLALGNIAGFAVARGLDDDQIEAYLPDHVREIVVGAINGQERKFFRSVARARERLHFIAQGVTNS